MGVIKLRSWCFGAGVGIGLGLLTAQSQEWLVNLRCKVVSLRLLFLIGIHRGVGTGFVVTLIAQ